MENQSSESCSILTLAEYASYWKVDQKTAARWARDGILPGAFKTPGGQWRVRGSPWSESIRREMAGEGDIPVNTTVPKSARGAMESGSRNGE